ncbi:MAG: class I SAM-dependent methyltransferase [SAR86 cluster bacterium]|nr:class I SAM-dependent methyltransferase [SAR86 cluster bacterium]MBL6811027.1 class I SAM-dependent methyltransferase [SAR86 cluster bacterium]
METFNFKHINLKKVKNMVDVGCGNGRHLKSLGFKLNEAKIIGIDQSFDEINSLRREFDNHICKNQNNYIFLNEDVRYIALPNNSQDLVICSEVLEHVPNFEKVLKECHRILKPGAVLLISVPTYFPESLCWKYSKKYMQTPGGHIRIFKNSFLLEEFSKLKLTLFKHHREHAMHSLYWIFKARNNMEDSEFLRSFHALLVKQMFGQAKFSYTLEKILNPFFGKSECYYLRK